MKMKSYRLAGCLLTLLTLVMIPGLAQARGPALSAASAQSPDATIAILSAGIPELLSV